jgi:hypothetical protein
MEKGGSVEKEKIDDDEISLPTMEEFKKQQENSSDDDQIPTGDEIHPANASGIYPNIDDLKSVTTNNFDSSRDKNEINREYPNRTIANPNSNSKKPAGISGTGARINFVDMIKKAVQYSYTNKLLGIIIIITICVTSICSTLINIIRNNDKIGVLYSRYALNNQVVKDDNFFGKILHNGKLEEGYFQLLKIISEHFTNNKTEAVFVLIIAIVLFIIAVYIYYQTTATIILATNNLDDGNNCVSLKETCIESKQYLWKIFGLDLLLWVLGIAVSFAISAIILSLVFTATSVLVVLLILGTIIIIPVSLYLFMLIQFAQRNIVLRDMGVFESLSDAKSFIDANFWLSVLSAIINIIIMIILTIIEVIVYFVSFSIIFKYLLSNSIGWDNPVQLFIAVVIVLGVLLVNIVISGLILSFFSSYWTLSFRALDYLIYNPTE